MCKNIKLLFSCSHSHAVRLSACRRTRTTLKKGYKVRPFCKPHKFPTLVPRISISTPCPECYELKNVERLTLELLDAAIVFHRYDAPMAKRNYERKLEELDEMCAMMREARIRQDDKRPNGANREEGSNREDEAASGGEECASEGGQQKKKKKKQSQNKTSTESVGGSPLRWELKVEDLVADEERQAREKELEAKMLSWRGMLGAVREMEVLPLRIEKRKKKDSVIGAMVGCFGA